MGGRKEGLAPDDPVLLSGPIRGPQRGTPLAGLWAQGDLCAEWLVLGHICCPVRRCTSSPESAPVLKVEEGGPQEIIWRGPQ